jgi:hypothetical protein
MAQSPRTRCISIWRKHHRRLFGYSAYRNHRRWRCTFCFPGMKSLSNCDLCQWWWTLLADLATRRCKHGKWRRLVYSWRRWSYIRGTGFTKGKILEKQNRRKETVNNMSALTHPIIVWESNRVFLYRTVILLNKLFWVWLQTLTRYRIL